MDDAASKWEDFRLERWEKEKTDRQTDKRDKKWDRRKNYAVSCEEKDRENARKMPRGYQAVKRGKKQKHHFNISDSSYTMLSSVSLWKKCA